MCNIVQLDWGGVDEPQYLRYARLFSLGIEKVDAEELASFTGLLYLDLSENQVSMVQCKEKPCVFAILHILFQFLVSLFTAVLTQVTV